MDRQDSVGPGASSGGSSPISSTNTSPEPSPPPSPTGSFGGRTVDEQEPTVSVRDSGTGNVLEQAATNLEDRKTTKKTVGSFLNALKKRRRSDPEATSKTSPTEISHPEIPASADAVELLRAGELKTSRDKNRKKLEQDIDLSDLSSVASNSFFAATGISPHKLSPLEKEMLQDQFRLLVEEYVNDKSPNYPEISKRMVDVSRKHCPVRQLAPNMCAHFDRGAQKVFCSAQMQSAQIGSDCDNLVKMVGGAVDNVAKQLRTPLFDRLFEGGTGVEQDEAYREIQAEIDDDLKTLDMLDEQMDTKSHPVIPAMKQDIELMRAKLKGQQSLLDALRRQDFRNQKNYQSSAENTLNAFLSVLHREKRKGTITVPVTDDAAKLSGRLEGIRALSSDQLRPNIVGDLIKLEKELGSLAHQYGISKPFKKALVKARSENGWEPIVRKVPVRDGLETKLHESVMTPMGVLLGYPGGVPSTGQDVTDKPCNGWVCEERSPEGQLTSRYVRSAVPDPYKAEGGDRIIGGHRRAELEYVAGLLSEYGGDADLLEQRFGTEAKAFTPKIMLESYLTTDQFRNRFHIHDNEAQMNALAYDNFATMADQFIGDDEYRRIEVTDDQGRTRIRYIRAPKEDGEEEEVKPHRLEFTDAQGQLRAIYINKPKVILNSCGSNSMALNPVAQVFTRSWNTADPFSRDAINVALGNPSPGAKLEGWVGEYLADHERRYERPHPQLGNIQKLADEWRSVVQLKEHHTAKLDTFKLINPSDAIWELLRDPNTLRPGQVPDEDAMVPVVRVRFCKSGKDRTGAGCASADRYRRELHTTGKVPVSEGGLTEDRKFNSQAGAVISQLEAQLANGYMGYKTNGEAKRLGESVDQARRFKDRELD